MSYPPSWHPRAHRASRSAELVAQYTDPAEPTYYIDEAGIFPEEVAAEQREFADEAETEALEDLVDITFGIPREGRLPFSPRAASRPRLSAEATKRVGAQFAQERRELAALQDAGLMPKEEER